MNKIKNITFTALLAICAFGAVTYTACNKDECKGIECNNGLCISGSCQCTSGYEGTNCTMLSSAKFTGNWRTTTEACTISGSNSQYDITVTTSGTAVTTLLIGNVYDAGRTVTATLTNANAFTIESQAFGSTGTISGTGSIASNQLTISYAVKVAGVSDVCNSVVYTKL